MPMRYEDLEILSLILRHKKEIISTKALAPLLNISQQSVSRKLCSLEKKGLIRRDRCIGGQRITVLDKGLTLVKSAISEFNAATKTKKQHLKFLGYIVSGSGEGAYYLSQGKYHEQLKNALGFSPFMGTLNLEIRDDTNLSKKEDLISRSAIIINGFSDGSRTFGDLLCFRCRINNKIDGAIIVPKRTHHDKRIVEIITSSKLRDTLALKDGDLLEVASY